MSAWTVDETSTRHPRKVAGQDTTPAVFTKSTMQRAKKRQRPEERERDIFMVHGEENLGDSYPYYEVRFAQDGTHHCTCQESPNGQYRPACSHAAAAGLERARIKNLAAARAKIANKGGVEAEQGEGAMTSGNVVDAPSPTPPKDASVEAATSTDARSGAVEEGGESAPHADLLLSTDLSIPDRDDPMFANPPLPDWVEGFRPHQWTAIQEVMDAYESGAQWVWLDAPTGAGKSLIGEVVMRMVAGPTGKGLYVATTKHLQDQFTRDFPYARVMKGRANYPTAQGWADAWGNRASGPNRNSITCADCTRTSSSDCTFCPSLMSCPYIMERNLALKSKIAVLNTAYLLVQALKGDGGMFAGRSIAVMDEADMLEGEVMGQAEVALSPSRLKKLGLGMPEKKTVASTWVEWVTDAALPAVTRALSKIPPLEAYGITPAQIRERKGLENLRNDLYAIAEDLGDGWVWDGYDRGWVTFKPVRVDRYGEQVGSLARKTMAMSATLISTDEMSDSLGLGKIEQETVRVPMTFPVENRPIFVVPVAEMTRKNGQAAVDKMCRAVAKVVALHPGERVLVHCVSYRLAKDISEWVARVTDGRRIITYTESGEKHRALETYLATPGAVMVASSMDRGVDLPGDACRVQVVAKIPFPFLGDKQVAARMHSRGGAGWYAVQTVRTLVQMTGRAVRSRTDHAVTYILDDSFNSNIWNGKRHLLPEWWKDSLRFDFDARKVVG